MTKLQNNVHYLILAFTLKISLCLFIVSGVHLKHKTRSNSVIVQCKTDVAANRVFTLITNAYGERAADFSSYRKSHPG